MRGNMKASKNRNSYIRSICNVLINILFFLIIIVIGLGIYKLIYKGLQSITNIDYIYGSLISGFITIMLAFISYITKIKKYLLILLNKIKQELYHFFSWKHNPFSIFTITDYNKNNLSESVEQGKIVNSVIHILKNDIQNMILISGYAGRGKTTSIMLLLNAIAQDKKLYWMFSELQNHIIYFDSVNDKDALLNYLDHIEKQKCKLIVIDNIHKYTISSINEIMDRIGNLLVYNQDTNKKVLIILLFQKTDRNNALYSYIENKFFKERYNIFKLDKYINLEFEDFQQCRSLQVREAEKNILKIEDPFFRQHMKDVFYNRKSDSMAVFLNKLIFVQPTKIPTNSEKQVFILAAAIFIGFYNGYVTRKELHFLWKSNYSFISLPQEELLIRNFVRNRVLTPFPFMHYAYIFNEHLAREYRKKLIHNDYYQEISDIMAKNMFLHCKEDSPQKWLLFLLCSSKYCKDFSQSRRIHFFENTLAAYHLQYILDLVESETSILLEKKTIFRQELGIIYIYNGEWAKAKQILYPYVQNHDINKDIWHIQLKIIEAEHGGSDEKYLEMLACMEKECTNPIILFQVKYWREHIRMEHGIFSLEAWEKLVQEITSCDELESLRTDEHFSTRVVADYERMYFLIGDIKYSVYKCILSEYIRLSNKNNQTANPTEYVLSRAYYIQYDVLYQLGIWGYLNHSEIEPGIISNPNLSIENNSINDLLNMALEKYDFCISKYQSEGKKKYRTLKVRRAELTLCQDSNQYIEVLKQYEDFEQYAKQNDIIAFEGYCKTQKGKAFALYADHVFRKGDFDRFKEYMNKAEYYLSQAQKIYKEWGNTYGVFRAELLTILVQIIQDRNHETQICISHDSYKNKYYKLFSDLNKKYNSREQFVREHDIIEYMQNNILSINLPLSILRFYPIILQ